MTLRRGDDGWWMARSVVSTVGERERVDKVTARSFAPKKPSNPKIKRA
jgi:hypothetical protein